MAPAQLSTIAEQETHRNLREENLRRHFRPLGIKFPSASQADFPPVAAKRGLLSPARVALGPKPRGGAEGEAAGRLYAMPPAPRVIIIMQ